MTDTRALLGKIAALRQRLEQAQGLASEATSAAASLVGDDGARLDVLQRKTDAGAALGAEVDATLRQLGEVAPAEGRVLPTRLTARARRILEQGRDLLARLRTFAESLPDDADPLARLYRDTAAMTDATLRMVQTFPDAPSAQLHLCEGLQVILGVVARRVALLGGAVEERRREDGLIGTLADLLVALAAGQRPDITAFAAVAEALVAEAHEAAPLPFRSASPDRPARFVACHSLTVARVMARLARLDPDLRGRPAEPVLAALVHDVGMLHVPADLLAHVGPLDDGQRRLIESHTRVGAEWVQRLRPDAPWLAEAALSHHERLDGTGYPGGLREAQVSSLTRLLTVCDVYAALGSPRPHRPARATRTALTDTLLLAEGGALDRHHAERLLQLSFYPVGTAVELADGSAGVVVATHQGRRELSNPARPVLALLTDAQGRPLPAPRHLDLAACDSRSVVRGLTPQERRALLGGAYPEWA